MIKARHANIGFSEENTRDLKSTLEISAFFDTEEKLAELQVLSVLASVVIIHCRIFIISLTLDLLVVVKPEEVFELWEFLLMSRHKIVDIVDSFVGHGSVFSKELLVGLLGLSIAGQ